VFEEVRGTSQRLYLKIDTQGFERNVIEGSKETLPCFDVVQMELALISNYHGESLIEEMIRLMRERGFVPWWFLDGFKNPKTLQLYQTDVFFVNKTKA
ncbi:MAG: FkbM family methyltransferase, partial [Pirellula sp.]